MIETSNRRDARPRSRTGWTRQRLDARREEPPPRPGFDRARWGRRGATLGLVGLTAVTSWVVASISVWLVPVYVGAMVLIFAAPRKNPTKPADETEADESSSVEDPIAGESVEMNTGAVDDLDAEPSVPVAEIEAPAETPPKPRKRKVRARKSAKKGTDPAEIASELGRVTWVRVGPGKFVRSVVPVVEFVGPPAPETGPEPEPAPSADDPPPAPGLGSNEVPSQDPWMNPEGPETPAEDLGEAVGLVAEYGHESEFAGPDASETAAEDYDGAPPDFGESLEAAASDFEADRDEVGPSDPRQAEADTSRDFYLWSPPAQF